MDLNKLLNATNKNVDLFNLNNKEIIAKIVNVYDADTCKAVFYLDNKLTKFTIRLVGINTPEIRPPKSHPNRNALKKFAMKARNRLIQLCTDVSIDLDNMLSTYKCQKLVDNNRKLVKIKCGEFDKYGRLLGTIYPHYENENQVGGGFSFNQILINEEFAHEYHGGTKKPFNI